MDGGRAAGERSSDINAGGVGGIAGVPSHGSNCAFSGNTSSFLSCACGFMFGCALLTTLHTAMIALWCQKRLGLLQNTIWLCGAATIALEEHK